MIMYGLKTVQTAPETGRKLFWYDGSDSAGSELFGVDLAVNLLPENLVIAFLLVFSPTSLHSRCDLQLVLRDSCRRVFWLA